MLHHRASARALAVAALCLAAVAGTAPARAQYPGGFGEGAMYGLGPYQVRVSLEQRGFRVLARPRRNGQVYVADVVDGMGRRERLVVDMADGGILQRFIVDDRADEGILPDVERRGSDVPNPYRDPQEDGYAPRASAEPIEPEGPRYGGARPEAPRPALVPPLRYVRPPSPAEEREGMRGHEERRASLPPAPAAAPRPRAVAPAGPVTVLPARPAGAVSAQAAPRHMVDPLAIPGGSERGPVRSVSPGITGAPPSGPARGGVPAVPAAPLD